MMKQQKFDPVKVWFLLFNFARCKNIWKRKKGDLKKIKSTSIELHYIGFMVNSHTTVLQHLAAPLNVFVVPLLMRDLKLLIKKSRTLKTLLCESFLSSIVSDQNVILQLVASSTYLANTYKIFIFPSNWQFDSSQNLTFFILQKKAFQLI